MTNVSCRSLCVALGACLFAMCVSEKVHAQALQPRGNADEHVNLRGDHWAHTIDELDGRVDLEEAGVVEGGAGYVRPRPDIAITTTDAVALQIGATSDFDTVMLVRTPSGRFLFNDDTNDLNPEIMTEAERGTFRVWVGVIAPDREVFSAEVDVVRVTPTGAAQRPAAATEVETGTTITLTEPRTLQVAAGGEHLASEHHRGCAGYTSRRPDVAVRLERAASLSAFLRFGEGVETDTSPILVVRTPSGQVFCTVPEREQVAETHVTTPSETGTFLIWAGTLDPDPRSPRGDLRLTAISAPHTGRRPQRQRTLRRGFRDLEIETESATYDEAHSADGIGDDCIGYIGERANLFVRLPRGLRVDLGFETVNGGDTTLVVRNPDGSFTCNDDGSEGFDPETTIGGEAGEYRIFVGDIMADNEGGHVGALRLSEAR